MSFTKSITAVSTNTRILILLPEKKYFLGAVQALSLSEERDVDIYNNIIGPIKVKGKIVRVRFDGNKLQELFNKQSGNQKQPFNLWLIDTIPQANGDDKQIRTELHNCWITKMSTTYKADDLTIIDEMDFEAERVVTQEHLTEDEEIIKDIIL